ncbi:hypothetical protein KDK_24080 [Dictyobacter kobayashii]|uniref:Uncharacterized protein n=1 Tax=Dictyobacter kobayashii TaxID=2014872 RepID=A0A402AHL5_9CHLR|nr:hypothetical protein KDK_24080 [Dictyobacter kobayashii]
MNQFLSGCDQQMHGEGGESAVYGWLVEEEGAIRVVVEREIPNLSSWEGECGNGMWGRESLKGVFLHLQASIYLPSTG